MTITSQGLSNADIVLYEQIKREARNDPQKDLELTDKQAQIVFDAIGASTDKNLQSEIAKLVKQRILDPRRKGTPTP
jgi:hypothetical protein